MRDIKFRAKVKWNGNHYFSGELVYGYFYKKDLSDKAYIIDTEEDEFGNMSFNEVEVDEKTLGQYTGQKDKNGIEIYEGDIIDIHQTVNGCNLFEIVWDELGFNAQYVQMKGKPKYEYNVKELLDVFVGKYDKEIEIIGDKESKNVD